MQPKVFCIGFHKTGTTSLETALRILGYRVTGPNGVRDPNIAQNALFMAKNLVPRFDAFQDNPWPLLFKELDHNYPGSKYILTLRDADKWLNSLLAYSGNLSTPMREWIYGCGSPKGNENIYLNRFNQHNQEVLNYFSSRPNDLLTMNIEQGDGWEKLCPFLNKPLPNKAFPHKNKAGDRLRALKKIFRVIGKNA